MVWRAGVPRLLVRRIRCINCRTEELLFISAVRTATMLKWPMALLHIGLLVRPLIGKDLLATVVRLMVSLFASIMLLIGTSLLGSICRWLFIWTVVALISVLLVVATCCFRWGARDSS